MDNSDRFKIPTKILKSQVTEKQLFFTSNGMIKRKIFFHVDYTQQQKELIAKFRKFASEALIKYVSSDQLILRYLYSSNMNEQTTLPKLISHHEWFNNQNIQTLNYNAEQIIKQGFIYLAGRCKNYHPVIVLNVSIVNLEIYQLQDYFRTINAVTNMVVSQSFVLGRIQTFTVIIDSGGKLLGLPLISLSQIVAIISNVYSMRLEKLYLVNCNYAIKLIYSALSAFLSEQTSRKIMLLTPEELSEGKLLEYINPQQLQRKYGGAVSDLTVYWPNHSNPQQIYSYEECSIKEESEAELEAKEVEFQYMNMSRTEYYSIIVENQQKFQLMNAEESNPCCSNQQCEIY